MSKTSKTGLTGSRKSRRGFLDVRDELNGRLRLIELLADLMGACRADLLPPGAVEIAGATIAREAQAIRAVLGQVGDVEAGR